MTSRVTVFGGDGFIGRYVVQALLKEGAMVCVASRNPKRGWLLKTQGNLGQIAFTGADVTRPDTLAAAVAGADVVINLVGSFANMDKVQREGALNVAKAATQAGVSKLVHLSAIGADSASASAYGRSKGEGEAAVRSAFPNATILRPSIVFVTVSATPFILIFKSAKYSSATNVFVNKCSPSAILSLGIAKLISTTFSSIGAFAFGEVLS